jgi:hypothetical protein
MPYKLMIVFLGICVLSSCSNQKKEEAQTVDSTDTAISVTLQQSKLIRFNDSLYYLFNKSPKELTSTLGKPKKSECEQVVNIHDGNIDTTYQLDFDSVSISLYYVSAQKQFLLGSVEVRNNSLLHILGLQLGAPDTTVIRTIGLSYKSVTDSTGMDILVYELGEANSYTEFHFKDSKLIRMLYLPYLD